MGNKTFSEKIRADKKSIGFDYQFYFFLLKALNLKTGDQIGLEVLDDVYILTSKEERYIFQIKHTLLENTDGTKKNLSTLDSDVWKTLNNWVSILSDPNDGRLEVSAQRTFLKETVFVLSTNKSEGQGNAFFDALFKFQNKEITANEILEVLDGFRSKTSNGATKKAIEKIISLDKEIAEEFLRKISFEFNEEGIIEQCEKAISEKFVQKNNIESVFISLCGALKKDCYEEVSKGHPVVLTFEDFARKYSIHFVTKRLDLLRYKRIETSGLTGLTKLEEQTFIKQLIDIKDIAKNEEGSILKYTAEKMSSESTILSWQQEGEVTSEEIDFFERNAKDIWEDGFHAIYREGNVTTTAQPGLTLLDEMRGQILEIRGQKLPKYISNGQYYSMSNVPIIGWEKNWEKIYKKNG